MDAQTLSSVLSNHSLLRNYPMADLQRLGQQHPYASVINALMAIKAHDENDRGYEYYLNQAAIRVPDRKRLYHLIHAQPDMPAEIAEPMEPAPLREVIVSQEITAPPKEGKFVEPEPVTVPAWETQKLVIKEETPEILRQPEEEAPLKLPGVEAAVEALKSINEAEWQLPTEQPEIRDREEEVVEVEAAGKKYSFTEWLSFIGQKKEVMDETAVPREFKGSAKQGEFKFSKANELTEKEEASIKKKAKESLSDDIEWVTETLAKIYELQKKYDKAEEAYKMLSLKYPDKKAYFAQRIEDLKRRLNG